MKTSLWRVGLALALAFAGVGVRADEPEPVGTVIGIDLGTTYSCVGVFKGGRVEIIANDQGNRITPSYVSWDSNGERLIGDAAKNQATINPETTVFDVKRLIGRSFSDKSVQNDMKLFPFKIVNKDSKPQVQVRSLVQGCRASGNGEDGLALGRNSRALPISCMYPRLEWFGRVATVRRFSAVFHFALRNLIHASVAISARDRRNCFCDSSSSRVIGFR